MLKRLQKSMDEKDKGFTLIELLVVVIIIGILAGIAIPIFLNQRKRGVDASLRSDARNAATQVETYITDNPTSGVPGATATSSSPGAAGGSLAGFRASSGNTVEVVPGAASGEYCIFVNNSASSGGASFIAYNSAKGGIQPSFVASKATCTATTP